MSINNPYHEGELAVQQRANEAEMAFMNSGALADAIPAGALRFIEQQPMVVAGSVDADGHVWASILTGNPGFAYTTDPKTVVLDFSESRTATDDPLWHSLNANENIGLVMIELGSRRRLRISGRARKESDSQYMIDVERAYPNCPKYIQRRVWRKEANTSLSAPTSQSGTQISETHKKLISQADTFFVTSAHPEQGIDASHRGGHPGFVHLINDTCLRIPDFVGNSMYNTLGNFTSYPFAGLAFIDFEHGRLLQLSGRAEILWDQDDPASETGGTQRYWQFEILSWRESDLHFKFNWEYMDASPHIPKLVHEQQTNNQLSLQVERIRQETDRIKSFRLRAIDSGQLPAFEPGAHLKVKVRLPNGQDDERHYSLLSSTMDRSAYEIAVLKEPQGRGGSQYLHEQIKEGDILECDAPKNEFPLTENAQHSLLIAGGIGITPILAMMHALAEAGKSYEIHYSARTKADLAFHDRIKGIAGAQAQFYTSQDRRLDLKEVLSTPKPGTHVYVCGPQRLISAVRDTANTQDWPTEQIHFESFGAQLTQNDKAFEVHLKNANKTLTIPSTKTLLDTLLEAGINVPHQCKRGECGLCVTEVTAGEPDHRDLYLNANEQTTSICVCVSRARSKSLTLKL